MSFLIGFWKDSKSEGDGKWWSFLPFFGDVEHSKQAQNLRQLGI